MDCSYPQLQDQSLWNNRRLQQFRAQMFSFTPKVDWDKAVSTQNKKVQIATLMVEQILINPAQIKKIVR